jgi:hypothetical protein
MKLIGYWIESLRDLDYYPPQEFVADLPLQFRNKIADYLDRGLIFRTYCGVSWCRFFCDYPMGNRELTDGYWVWPEDLSHYVRDHSVLLPSEFVCHVESNPVLVSKEDKGKSLPDTDFWKQWCRRNSSGKYRARLDAARQRADCEAERIFTDTITAMEAATGISETPCRWAGCDNKALVGKALCARCILDARKDQIVCKAYYGLRAVFGDAH